MPENYLKNNYAIAINYFVYGVIIFLIASNAAWSDQYNATYNNQVFPLWQAHCFVGCFLFSTIVNYFKNVTESGRVLNYVLLVAGMLFWPTAWGYEIDMGSVIACSEILLSWFIGYCCTVGIKKIANNKKLNIRFFIWLFNLGAGKRLGMIILIITLAIAIIMEIMGKNGDGSEGLLLIYPIFFLFIWFIQFLVGRIIHFASKNNKLHRNQ